MTVTITSRGETFSTVLARKSLLTSCVNQHVSVQVFQQGETFATLFASGSVLCALFSMLFTCLRINITFFRILLKITGIVNKHTSLCTCAFIGLFARIYLGVSSAIS